MPEVSIERLRKIEWEGDNCYRKCCPVCRGVHPANMPKGYFPPDSISEYYAANRKYGHKKGCWLAELLKPADEE